MKIVTAPSGNRLLLIWRTEFLFYTPERRQLAAEWNHVRLTSMDFAEGPNWINHALDTPLPFANESFDAIYCFHVVEHLNPRKNESFMSDVCRLLKPRGILRVSTPDLEFLAAEYLKCLREQLTSATADNYARYRWAVCNLIDQCTREVSGGEMLEVIRRGEYLPEHVKHMNGDLLPFLFPAKADEMETICTPRRVDVVRKAGNFSRRIANALRRQFYPRRGPQKSYLEVTHERNLWLFDRVSLTRLFSGAGFRNITAVTYRTSNLPDWNRYNFDQSAYGDYPTEPSIYIEGTK